MEEENYKRLKRLYSEELLKLYNLTVELLDVTNASLPPSDQSEVPDFVSQHLALCFKASAEELNSRPPPVLPNNVSLLLDITVKRLEQGIKGSKELLEYVKSERAKLSEALVKLKGKLREEAAVLEMVKEQLALPLESTVADPNARTVHEQKIRYKKLKALKKKRMNQLSEFLEAHYPRPDRDEFARDDIFNLSDSPPYQSLASLIQKLVSLHLQNPNAWITIDSSMCPKYVDLLLLSTIAVRNPRNASKIRLQNFIE